MAPGVVGCRSNEAVKGVLCVSLLGTAATTALNSFETRLTSFRRKILGRMKRAKILEGAFEDEAGDCGKSSIQRVKECVREAGI